MQFNFPHNATHNSAAARWLWVTTAGLGTQTLVNAQTTCKPSRLSPESWLGAWAAEGTSAAN